MCLIILPYVIFAQFRNALRGTLNYYYHYYYYYYFALHDFRLNFETRFSLHDFCLLIFCNIDAHELFVQS